MPIPLAYFGVVLIWSTTPLAIAWSGEAAGFIFGVSSRMLLGLILIFIFAAMMRRKLVWHYKARLAYLYGGLGIYASMLAVYWAAQQIPSGWVSVLFGLTPIFSAIMASFWLQGEFLTRHRLAGILLGFIGLMVVFSSSLDLNEKALFGVLAVILSGVIHSASAIWVKRVNANIPAISMTAGSLLLATPLFVLTWLLTQPGFSETQLLLSHASNYTLIAIAYLALFGSVFGFSLYFFVLQHVEATRVALIALITPITSLFLGYYFNDEHITFSIILGAGLIISGLAWFELGDKPLPKWIPFRPN
ncbi:MAG: DMT family transporter [Mariprofundaceae bacterium]|nr:DMT family transporter [Mariprofundaceae bacterium]